MLDQKNKTPFPSEDIDEDWFSYATNHSEQVPEILIELEKETYQKVLQPDDERQIAGRGF